MVILRPTRKLQTALPPTGAPRPSDTALGDWYVNRLVVDRQALLLLVSSTSLLPILARARDVRTLPLRLPDLVSRRLVRVGIEPLLVEAERRAMAPVQVAATVDRSVLGIMVDFARVVPFYLDDGGWDDTTSDAVLDAAEDRLAETPCRAGIRQAIVPEQAAPALLAARWGA